MSNGKKIQNQVKLPLSVAFGVVMQGIRIRLGRSLVTLAGVTLGIAFLMSILTGQMIRRGVGQETAMRVEIKRMMSFLVSETGPLDGRTLGVLQTGKLSPVEKRFVTGLVSNKVAKLKWCTASAQAESSAVPAAILQTANQADLAKDASAVLILGDAQLPANLDVKALLTGARQQVLAFSRLENAVVLPAGISGVKLSRELLEDEKAKIELEARQTQFRTGWIIVISLLVTVIGISNAMLMSVTERFREIGTMKCLGALSVFIREIFFIESSLMGLVGSIAGSLFGGFFAWLIFVFTYGFELCTSALSPMSLAGYFLLCVVSGVVLSIVAAIYPASFASKMVPAVALRSNI